MAFEILCGSSGEFRIGDSEPFGPSKRAVIESCGTNPPVPNACLARRPHGSPIGNHASERITDRIGGQNRIVHPAKLAVRAPGCRHTSWSRQIIEMIEAER
jgi:hypothetical protein